MREAVSGGSSLDFAAFPKRNIKTRWVRCETKRRIFLLVFVGDIAYSMRPRRQRWRLAKGWGSPLTGRVPWLLILVVC